MQVEVLVRFARSLVTQQKIHYYSNRNLLKKPSSLIFQLVYDCNVIVFQIDSVVFSLLHTMSLGFWIVIILGLVFANELGDAAFGDGGVLPKPCNLRCWLAGLRLELPPQTFVNGSFSAALSEFSCTGITVGQIYSDFRQPYAVHMTASGVGLTCSFNWRVEAFRVLQEHGTASVAVANSQLAGLLALHRASDSRRGGRRNDHITTTNNDDSNASNANSKTHNNKREQRRHEQRPRFVEDENAGAATATVGAPIDSLPTSLSVSDCSGQFYATIDFRCGFICKIIELFSSQINSFVNDELDEQVCLQIATLAAVNGTAALGEFNTFYVDPLLLPPPPAALSVLAPDSVSLINNSAVSLVDYVLDEVVGYNGSLNVNRIANYFTNGTGSLYLDPAAIREFFANVSSAAQNFTAFPNVSFVINATGTVTLQIESLNISGLNTWSTFDVLRPVSNWTLRSRTAVSERIGDFKFRRCCFFFTSLDCLIALRRL